MEIIYDNRTPVCEGLMLNLVPTVSKTTTAVIKIPQRSSRMPSQRCQTADDEPHVGITEKREKVLTCSTSVSQNALKIAEIDPR